MNIPPVMDYSMYTTEMKSRLLRLDRALPLKDWVTAQEEAAKLVQAAKGLHEWVVEKMVR